MFAEVFVVIAAQARWPAGTLHWWLYWAVERARVRRDIGTSMHSAGGGLQRMG